MDSEEREDHRTDDRAERDAHRATRYVDGHRDIALLLRDDGVRIERAERVIAARTDPCRRREDEQHRKGWRKADGGEHHRRPDEREANEARAVAVGDPAKEGLRNRSHAAIGERDEADCLEVEREAVSEQGIEDGEQPDIEVHREVAGHQCEERAVAEHTRLRDQ